MKKLIMFFIAFVLMVSSAGLAAAPSVMASTTSDVYDIVNNIVTQEEEIFDNVDAESAESFTAAFDKYVNVLEAARDMLDGSATEAGAELKSYIDDISEAVGATAAICKELKDAYLAEDHEVYLDASSRFSEATVAINAAADAYDQYLKDNPEVDDWLFKLYQTLFFVSIGLVIVAGAVFMVTIQKKAGKNDELVNASKRLLGAAAFALIGSGITYFWYKSAIKSESGSYYIVYGPIAVGYISFIAGIVQYLKVSLKLKKEGKKAINVEIEPSKVDNKSIK